MVIKRGTPKNMGAAISTPLRHLIETRRNYGAAAAARWLSSRFAEKLLCFEISELFSLDVATLPPYVEIDPDFSFRLLSHSEIVQLAEDPSYCLAAEFVDRATFRQDLCVAAFRGERLASYSWYTRDFVEGQDHLGVPMSLPTDFAYMYNAFTHPECRGRRLFSTGVALASKTLAGQGVSKVVTTVNSSNFASLRSCRRLGFISLGQMWTLGRGERRIARTPAAARKLGIRFGSLSNMTLATAN